MSRRSSSEFCTWPLLWLAICFAAGIIFCNFIPMSPAVSLAAFVLAGLSSIIFRSKVALLFLSFATASAGMLSYSLELRSVRTDRIRTIYDTGTVPSGSPVELTGSLIRSPEASPDGKILMISVDRLRYRQQEISTTGDIRLLLPEPHDTDPSTEFPALKYGSEVTVACALEREDEYLNPGVITRREILDRMGVDATCVLKSSLLLEHLSDESVFVPLAWIYDQRSKMIDSFRRNLSPAAAGVMSASLLGNRQFLDRSTAEIFREGGTFHILVISGLHITFLGGLLLAMVRVMTRNRWFHFIVTSGVLWGYALAVGADTPVIRAALMFTAILLAYALYRRSALQNMLGLCAILLLAWQPSAVFDPSFQLTFVSVLSISAIGYPLLERLREIGAWVPGPAHPFPANVPTWLRRWCESLYWKESAWAVESKRHIWTARLAKQPYFADMLKETRQTMSRWLFEGLLISMVVQICMLPLSVVYFHRVSFGSVIFNLWVGFWLALETFLAVAGALFSNVSDSLATPIFLMADLVNLIMLALPRLASGASTRVAEYPAFGKAFYGLHFVPILIAAILLAKWDPFDLRLRSLAPPRIILPVTFSAIILLSGIIVLHPFSAPGGDGRLHIDFLDVGQGDSAFITFPGGETMLVDGGGRIDYRSRDGDDPEAFKPDIRGIGESVVSEVLWEKGYSSVDLMAATHADADHMQGLVDIVRNFRVGRAIVGGAPSEDPEFAEFDSALKDRRVPLEILRAGDSFALSGVNIEVLHPEIDAPNISDNDHSMVVLLTFGDRRILLTGDIEKNAEELLVGNSAIGAVDVLKVPHHGSRTSSTMPFVNLTHPLIGVISVGRQSPFGHPHSEVVDRWISSGAAVLTTGEKGMITISTDGTDLRVARYVP